MNNKRADFVAKGYFLLPESQRPGYRGIDRNPFEPLILDEDVEQEQFLPKQEWRRKAYEIFRENLVNGSTPINRGG